MHNFAHNFFLHYLIVFLVIAKPFLVSCTHFDDIIFYSIESPERKDDKMTSLRVLAANFVDHLIVFIIYFELLKFLGQAAAIQNCPLNDLPHVLVMQVHVNSRPI